MIIVLGRHTCGSLSQNGSEMTIYSWDLSSSMLILRSKYWEIVFQILLKSLWQKFWYLHGVEKKPESKDNVLKMPGFQHNSNYILKNLALTDNCSSHLASKKKPLFFSMFGDCYRNLQPVKNTDNMWPGGTKPQLVHLPYT